MTQYVYVRKAVDDLVPGMVLGKMLVTSEGKNFLNEGAVLTLRIIQTLQMWGFRQIEIREEVPVSAQSSLTEESFENTEAPMAGSPEEISREEISVVEEPEPVEAQAAPTEVAPEVGDNAFGVHAKRRKFGEPGRWRTFFEGFDGHGDKIRCMCWGDGKRPADRADGTDQYPKGFGGFACNP